MECLLSSALLSSPMVWIGSGLILGVITLLGFRWLSRCGERDLIFRLDPFTILNKRRAKGFLTESEYEAMRRCVATCCAAMASLDEKSREGALFHLKRYANGDMSEGELREELMLRDIRRES